MGFANQNLSIEKQVSVSCLVGWWSFAVKGFWALWDNIYECMYLLL
jgi:hypothetical protein